MFVRWYIDESLSLSEFFCVTHSLLSSPLETFGPRFGYPQLAESFWSYSQLGSHEIAPPTPYVLDTLSLSVGLQFRGTDFAEISSCSRVSPGPNLLYPGVFQCRSGWPLGILGFTTLRRNAIVAEFLKTISADVWSYAL